MKKVKAIVLVITIGAIATIFQNFVFQPLYTDCGSPHSQLLFCDSFKQALRPRLDRFYPWGIHEQAPGQGFKIQNQRLVSTWSIYDWAGGGYRAEIHDRPTIINGQALSTVFKTKIINSNGKKIAQFKPWSDQPADLKDIWYSWDMRIDSSALKVFDLPQPGKPESINLGQLHTGSGLKIHKALKRYENGVLVKVKDDDKLTPELTCAPLVGYTFRAKFEPKTSPEKNDCGDAPCMQFSFKSIEPVIHNNIGPTTLVTVDGIEFNKASNGNLYNGNGVLHDKNGFVVEDCKPIQLGVLPAKVGSWVKIVTHVVWSKSKSQSLVEVWMVDGQGQIHKVANRITGNTEHREFATIQNELPPYLKLGQYVLGLQSYKDPKKPALFKYHSAMHHSSKIYPCTTSNIESLDVDRLEKDRAYAACSSVSKVSFDNLKIGKTAASIGFQP
jgi:hypothetical protein